MVAMNWSDYSYASDGSIMVVFIIILGALATYLLLDKRTRTDKWSGVEWQVWFDRDNPTNSVVVIVPHRNVFKAREWIYDNTGIRPRSMAIVDTVDD